MANCCRTTRRGRSFGKLFLWDAWEHLTTLRVLPSSLPQTSRPIVPEAFICVTGALPPSERFPQSAKEAEECVGIYKEGEGNLYCPVRISFGREPHRTPAAAVAASHLLLW